MSPDKENPGTPTKADEDDFPLRKPGQGLAEWLMEIGRITGPLMDDGRTSKELMDELYDDETGLPK
jgi:hypothetical protein